MHDLREQAIAQLRAFLCDGDITRNSIVEGILASSTDRQLQLAIHGLDLGVNATVIFMLLGS